MRTNAITSPSSSILISLFLAAACGDNTGTDQPDLTMSSDMAGGAQVTAVVTSRDSKGQTGAINTVALADRKVSRGIDTTLDGDTTVRVHDHKAYILNRTKATVRVYDAKTWGTPVEISAGDMAHPGPKGYPQDLMPLPGTTKIYVSFNGNDKDHAIGVVDTTKPILGVIKWISVPLAAGDPDGKPELGALYLCKGTLWAAAADLDQKTTFAPIGPGRLVGVDTAAEMSAGAIQLKGQNPGSIAAEGADCSRALVAASGPFGIEPDATSDIERVDLSQKTSLGVLFSGAELSASPAEVQVASDKLAFATVYYDLQLAPGGMYKILSSARVIAFDPSQKKVLGDVSDKAGFISFMRLSPDGQLLFGVNVLSTVDNTGKLKGGLYIGRADGTKVPPVPIDLGQDPYAVAFE